MELKKNYSEEKIEYNVKAILFVLLLGSFLALFNETILNVALPKLMVEMKISAVTSQWLTTGYVLVVGILVPVTAFLINTFTTKQLYVSAMLVFLLGTILATTSSSFTTLLISRLVQGCGTGMLIPIMMNSALVITPPEKHGATMGLCISIMTLGPALGPTASGLLLQFFSWHALFLLIIPFIVICIAGGLIFLKNTSQITKPKMDYLSIVLSTIGFAAIIYSVSSAGTSSIKATLLLLAIGFIALIIYGRRQLTLKQPILDIRAFKKIKFSIGVVLIILIQMFQFSINMLLPMLLQDGLKTTSFVSALALLPAILLGCILTPFIGKIFDKVGGKILIPVGLALMCIFTFIMSRATTSFSVILMAALYCFIMVGVSMSMSTSQTTALSQLNPRNRADGVAIVNTAMQIAGALGSALFVGIMNAYQNIYLQNTGNDPVKAIYSGFNHSVAAAAVLMAIGFILSFKLNSKNKSAA